MNKTFYILLSFFCSTLFSQKLDNSKWEFNGQLRGRYESLDGQFREGKSGSDQLLLFRTQLHIKYQSKPIIYGIEFQDSRTYLGTENSPLSSSFTNTTDLLQGYLKINTKPLFLKEGTGSLKLGRQTVSIGSKRQIERVSYANVIRAYTGGHYHEKNSKKDEIHLFYVVPVERLPKEQPLVLNNDFEWDTEIWNQHLWAAHYRNCKPFKTKGPQWVEAFIYGFDEKSTKAKNTANRFYITTGFRLLEPIKEKKFNYDIEFAYRMGSRLEENDSNTNNSLNVSAHMLLFRVGYTFKLPLKINVAFQHYEASGDKNPMDNKYQQFERLFGGRRTDLNNTSIHGPLTPANLSATGLRIELIPEARWDARIHYSYANLASATDKFIIGKYHDPSGNSGRFLGHTLDSRVRFWNNNKSWILDFGASTFMPGYYTRTLRANENSTKNTVLGYVQIIKRL